MPLGGYAEAATEQLKESNRKEMRFKSGFESRERERERERVFHSKSGRIGWVG